MRNKFIEIEQYLQSIEKLLRSNSIFYIAKNFKRYSRENRSLCEQDNLFSATNNANNFIMSIIKIIVTIQIKDSISNN